MIRVTTPATAPAPPPAGAVSPSIFFSLTALTDYMVLLFACKTMHQEVCRFLQVPAIVSVLHHQPSMAVACEAELVRAKATSARSAATEAAATCVRDCGLSSLERNTMSTHLVPEHVLPVRMVHEAGVAPALVEEGKKGFSCVAPSRYASQPLRYGACRGKGSV